MKNNFKALLLHFIIVMLSFIFLVIFVATAPKTGKYTTHIIGRVLTGSMFIIAYIFSGTLLDWDKSKKYDFLVGTFIGIIGIFLWFYTFLKTRINLFEIIPKELSEPWILINIYQTPFTLIDFLFRLPNIPILSLITNLFPTLLMGFGLKYRRLKHKTAK